MDVAVPNSEPGSSCDAGLSRLRSLIPVSERNLTGRFLSQVTGTSLGPVMWLSEAARESRRVRPGLT
jgi:hypothetical protein